MPSPIHLHIIHTSKAFESVTKVLAQTSALLLHACRSRYIHCGSPTLL